MSEPNCQECGACCRALPSWEGPNIYVRLNRYELERFTAKERKAHVVDFKDEYGAVAALGMIDRRCSALDGEIGCSVSCQVYENRPEICREFQPNSDQCLGARDEAGLTFGE
jgi:Fe-S-cluster containining protein